MFEIDVVHILDEGITFRLSNKRQFTVRIKDSETHRKVLNCFIQGNEWFGIAQRGTFICGIQGFEVIELFGRDKHYGIEA